MSELDLPPVRGQLLRGERLAPFTWFRVGGPAEALFLPADVDDLSQFLAALPSEVPLLPIGVGSNLIVRDGGVPGVVIRLAGRQWAQVETLGRTGVEMEALTAVQIGLLTIYDMCKAADRGMVMDAIRVLEKRGGKSGEWMAPKR